MKLKIFVFLKNCEQFKVIFKNSHSLNTFAVDIRKKVLIEIKRRENVQEIHRDIKKNIAIKQLLNNRIIKTIKTLISNTMLGKDSLFLMPLMLLNS